MSEIKVGQRVKVNEKYGEMAWGESDGSMEEMRGQTGTVTELGMTYHTVTLDKAFDGEKKWLLEARELDLV